MQLLKGFAVKHYSHKAGTSGIMKDDTGRLAIFDDEEDARHLVYNTMTMSGDRLWYEPCEITTL